MNTSRVVESAEELSQAIQAGAMDIEVRGTVSGMPMLTLGPGVRLHGGTLKFGAKGIRLTTGNTLDGVAVLTADDEVAILNDTSVSDFGTLTLRNVRTTGQVLLVARDAVRSGHVKVEGLTIDRADVRGRSRRPHGFGVEARGFNVYDGSLRHASFASIATHGDGSVGVQVSKPLPILEISGDLTTDGGEGMSLVKGVQVALKAIALSVKPGGKVGTVKIGGRVRTMGDHVVSLEVEDAVERIDIAGGIVAEGKGSDGVHVRGEVPGLSGVNVQAAHGQAIVRKG